jgi:hypothetical protein
VARDRGRVPAGAVRRGDQIRIRGRAEDVKAVRARSSSGGASVVLVLKAARAVRKGAAEKVTAEGARTRRGWFR